jgi:hypothetical protein
MTTVSIVVLFSGGIASWATARRLADARGVDGMTLLFTDTMTEDEDLYRFLDEAAADIGAPLVRLADGRDIWQVFRDERFLGNTRADPCSRILKRELSRRWLAEHAPDAAVAIGFDWTEVHRLERARAAWAPREVLAPMVDPPYRLRAEMIADLEARGISAPRLYRLGFEHNNCGGGCVKAGQGHFAQLLSVFPARYAEWEAREQDVREHIGADVSILRDRAGEGPTRTLTLRGLRERIEAGQSVPLWEVGGCGCFEEPRAESRNAAARRLVEGRP